MVTKKLLQQEVAKAVGAGKAVALETVYFNDPNRPKTCIEVDFPIQPVNQVAIMEGKAGNPIYQMSKWWARRRSSVFRSMLIAVATKAPEDKSHAAKLVWDNYYANHQKKGAFKHLKVADIFMGGGTTLVEGSRLGMQMVGNDFSRHNGKVYVDEGRTISVRDELVGINQAHRRRHRQGQRAAAGECRADDAAVSAHLRNCDRNEARPITEIPARHHHHTG